MRVPVFIPGEKFVHIWDKYEVCMENRHVNFMSMNIDDCNAIEQVISDCGMLYMVTRG